MDIFNQFITNVGFPIAVTIFLLVRIEKKLDDVNKTLLKMMEIFSEKLSGDRYGK